MMQNTLLSNLSMNLSRMDKLQNQLSSGRKYGHISDDPSALIYGQAARNKLARLSHYQGTVETAQSWLTQAEAGTLEVNKVIGAVYEELVSGGGAKTETDKQILAMVVKQLQDHYLDTLNSSFGDRFVFGGYNTPGDWADGRPPEGRPFTLDDDNNLLFNGFNISQFNEMDSIDFDDMFRKVDLSGLSADAAKSKMLTEMGFTDDPAGEAAFDALHGFEVEDAVRMNRLLNDVIEFEVGPGITMPVTQNGIDVVFFMSKDPVTGNPIMRNTYDLLTEVHRALNENESTDDLTILIGHVQEAQNHLLTKTAEIGGRQRRLELLEARYAQDNLNYEKMRSDAEDADLAEVIMFLKMAETVYQAALSAGARVIQPTLMDFLR
jgi:flagellar hook-associated protein 3 FlgL